MKIKMIILGLFLIGHSVFAQHDHGGGHSIAPVHPKKEVAPSSLATREFQSQLSSVFNMSLQLKDALVSSDSDKAAATIPGIKETLTKVDLSLLKDEALMDWMGYLKIINENLDSIGSNKDLQSQRKAFSAFSDALYKGLKQFGSGGIMVYHDYCPMANNNKGAYWLSNEKEIKNPYFGGDKLSCGSVKEMIH